MFGGSTLFAKEVKKTLSKDFKTNSSTVISMDTKFSELTVETWNKNEASFEVTIVVDHDDEAKAKKMLDLLNVEFDKDGNEITVETVMSEKFSKTDWGKTKTFKFIILAKIPASVNFELENSLGKVEIGDLTGKVDIESNLGSVGINSLTGESTLTFNLDDARIGFIKSGDIQLNLGKLNIDEAGDIDITMGKGNCQINKVVNLTAEVNMGDLIVDELDAKFESLSIESAMGNVEIGINKDAGFTLSSEMSMGKLTIPKLDKQVKDKEGMNTSVEGTYGNGRSSVEIEGSMGSVSIKIK